MHFQRENNVVFRLDLPEISKNSLLEKIKNVLDENLPFLAFGRSMPFRAIIYEDNIKLISFEE